MENRVPFRDLSVEIETLWDEFNAAFQSVLRSGEFILGYAVQDFERQVADYLKVGHAIGVNSGTDALIISLRVLGIQSGDEVITTAFSAFPTAEAISSVGARPIFVDIDPRTYNLDVNLIEARITERTKAILPVHLYGQSCDMDAILALGYAYGLKVVEDVAQAFGGKYKGKALGTIGVIGGFSFFPTKNLGAFGDAGLIATNDGQLAEVAQTLRSHGAREKYFNEVVGYNSRMDAIQAKILEVKLPYVDVWNDSRRRAAKTYDELLRNIPGVIVPSEAPFGEYSHTYHQYTVRILNGKRDAIREQLRLDGISTIVYYPVPLHWLPVYDEFDRKLPVAEQASMEVLSLPIWAGISEETQGRVASSLRKLATIHL